MGGKPLLALNIVCFPDDRLKDLEEIIRGGLEKVKEAGAIVAGGHSVKDSEPKYGLAVLGLVHPDRIIRNNRCQEGDSLILTKPLGTGIISTALKIDEITTSDAKEAISWMTKLNNISDDILKLSINSMTDITGFGLLGHLSEMLEGVNIGADIKIEKIPFLKGAIDLSQNYIIPAGSQLNQKTFSCGVEKKKDIDPSEEILLYDAQTSGGLLISVVEKDEVHLLKMLKEEGFTESSVIGNIRKIGKNDKKIRLI